MIHFQKFQRRQGHLLVDSTPGLYLGVVPDPTKEAVGDPRGAPGTAGHFLRPLFVDIHGQDMRGSPNDHRQFHGIVEIEPETHPEAVPEGRGEKAGPGRRAHQGKPGDAQFH